MFNITKDRPIAGQHAKEHVYIKCMYQNWLAIFQLFYSET